MTFARQSASAPSSCRHCGEQLEGATSEFCCTGCRAAFAVIEGAGLGGFYDRLVLQAGGRRLKPEPKTRPDLALHIEEQNDLCTLTLMIDGLHCAACVWLIESLMARKAGMVDARVSFATRRLRLRWRGGKQRGEEWLSLLEGLGFHGIPFDPAKLDGTSDRVGRDLLRCLAVAGFASGNVMLLSVSVWAGNGGSMGGATRDMLHWLSAMIALPAVLYAGRPFFRSAWNAIGHGRTNMDVPITIGVTLTCAMSLAETWRHGPHAFFDSSVTLLFFLLIGRLLDHRTRGQTRLAAAQLLSLGITSVTRLDRQGGGSRVALADIAVGDILLVAAGEKIAADGQVIQGESDVDTSLVTGESLPRPIAPGGALFAGMVNLSAPLTLRVSALGEATLLAEILRLMEQAEQGRGRYQAMADRMARLYAPFVHGAALACFAFWVGPGGLTWQDALLRAVAVLIITCPCAIGLAIPAVQVVAIYRLLRRGVLVKSGSALERLAKIDQVLFDKTGTLTSGELRLRGDRGRDAASLALAAGMARHSHHPLSRALAATCPVAPLLTEVEELPGRGLRSGANRLGSRAWLGLPDDNAEEAEFWLDRPGRAPVRFAFAETPRADLASLIMWLKNNHLRPGLLSGDRPAAVAALARIAGIDDWQAGLDPTAKLAAVTKLQQAGHRVLMVGDGLNDAPAMLAADVSLSPAGASDLVQIKSDIVVQGESLAPVADVIAIARRADLIVRQNLALAVTYNITAIPLAVAGLVTPLLAAVLMSASSILVVLNALRLRQGRPVIAA